MEAQPENQENEEWEIEDQTERDEEDMNIEVESTEKVPAPTLNMLFDSSDEIYEYYRKYGIQMGFGIMKRSSRKLYGVDTYLTVACHRFGEPQRKATDSLQPQPVVKAQCKARICAKRLEDGKWCVTQFDDEHNHVLSPSKTYRYRCNRKLTTRAKRSLDLHNEAGIPMNKTFNAIVIEHGGHENMSFNKKDCENYMRTVRQLRLAEGDASALQSYFNHVQVTDSNFYYSIDLGIDNRIINLFWADGRCRAAYEEFGDVITFDTTYLTNKYDMPFAPFVGVNHHGQSTLLGCGLISSEDTETFTWLFRSWLTCMSGNSPHAIITDQDMAMKNAIEIVFPHTRHRLCLWHIMKKIPEKLKGYKEYNSIKRWLENVVHDSISIEDFESGWSIMVGKYDLGKNEWLNGLYEMRKKWVPCFVKDNFWAGMSTTQRSESMNAFFDGYVNAKTSLREFVDKYDIALKDKVEKEIAADTRCLSTSIPCVTNHDMEKQVQLVYTNDKFKEFQKEIISVMYCESMLLQSNGSTFHYQVEEIQYVGDSKVRRNVNFNVRFIQIGEKDYDINCDCRLFEFRGIICRHIVKVLIFKHDIFFLPEKYILRRWRKDIKRKHTKTKVSYSTWKDTEEGKMYSALCDDFYEIADLAIEKKERCKQLVSHFGKLKLEWQSIDKDGSINESSSAKSKNDENIQPSTWSLNIRSPIKRRGKGRPPTKRRQSHIDKIVTNLRKSRKIGKKKPSTSSTSLDMRDNIRHTFDLNETISSETEDRFAVELNND